MLLLLLACAEPPAPRAAPEVVEVAAPAPVEDAVAREDIEALRRTLASLDERLGNLELEITRVQEQGLLDAQNVRFDPSRTTLAARELQGAVTELHERLDRVEKRTAEPMGPAGPGLFAMPRDDQKGQPQGPGGGPMDSKGGGASKGAPKR